MDYALCITVLSLQYFWCGSYLQGVPIQWLLMSHYQGNIFGLLNPFALLCGVWRFLIYLQGSMQ